MEPVIFHPKDSVDQETKNEKKPLSNSVKNSPESSTPDTSSTPELELPESTNSAQQSLPSLEIPTDTIGKIPKLHTAKTFIKVLITTYVIATAAGIIYTILLA